VKLLVTDEAAAYSAFPAWLATTVQVPAETSVIVAPFAVHTAAVDVVKVTANLEVAVALTVTGDWARVFLPTAAKVIVCAAWDTVKLLLTAAAAVYAAFPA
jgi:hypothetical protein